LFPQSTIYLDSTQNSCSVGGRCQFYDKSIGITLDDILRDQIRPNMLLYNQPFLVKMSAVLTIIMFVAGLINSVFSFITFQNKDLRKTGCAMYLLASSVTSLLTISMFTVKFWFVVVTHMNMASISWSIFQGGCVSIEPILKLFAYLNAWLNACVATERAVNVFKGISFDKKKSKHIARWIIIILPFCIMATIIHEFRYRKLIEYDIKEGKIRVHKTKRYVWCLTHYSPSVQNYNTIILFFHLLGPFIANLFSALFIIFGTTRQRSATQHKQTFRENLRDQLNEHKQIVISPIVLLTLALPRLIISILSGCMNTSRNPWLFLSAYFISFTPSILVFVVFVLPSKLFRKRFKESIKSCRYRRQVR
jgi:hypothetical protein